MTEHEHHDEYLTEAEASAILNRSPRQVRRYGRTGKVTVREGPGGRLYRRADVELLAAELRDKDRTRPAMAEVVPSSDLLDMIDRKDAEIRELNRQIAELAARASYLQGQIDAQEHQRLLTGPDIDQERRPPWWVRWLLRSRR